MNSWDQRFAADDYVFGTEPAKALLKLETYLVPGGKTLVVADGEGRNSVYLASKGFDVTATDYSEVGLSKARRLAQERNVYVHYVMEDIFERDWSSEQYDNVVALFIQFVPPSHMTKVLSGLATALKPNGTLLVHGYTPKQVEFGTGGPPNPEHMYTGAMLRDVYQQLDIRLCEAYEDMLDEGSGHSGKSALIDFVGIKKA
jgi:SAM-dependent methyltransferase